MLDSLIGRWIDVLLSDPTTVSKLIEPVAAVIVDLLLHWSLLCS